MESDASPARLKFFDRTKGKQCCTIEYKDTQYRQCGHGMPGIPYLSAVVLHVQAVFSCIQRPSTSTVVNSHQAGWCTQILQRPARST